MSKPLHVLVVEDSEADALLMIFALQKGGYDTEHERVETAGAMRAALLEKTWDVILCDYLLPQFNGLAAIALLKETNIDIPLIIVSGAIGEQTAADCMRFGAQDYVMKSNLSRLVPAIERELKEAESRRQRRQTLKELKDRESELASIYENGPLIMILADKEWTIRKVNAVTAQFAGRAMGDMINLRCGESLHCIHSLDTPEGCGFGPSCRECTLRRTAINTIETGQSHHDVEARMSLSNGVKKRETLFLLSTAKLTIKGQSTALICMQDITERRRAEEALIQRNRRLDMAQTVAKAGTWDWDIVTGHIEWSSHMFGLFGLDPQKTTASFEVWRSVLHPEDLEIAGQRIDDALKKRLRLNSDYRIILPDEQIRWINSVGESEYDSQGRPVRMLGICIDITERKWTEDSLRRSEENFRASLDDSPMGVRIVTEEGKTLYANRAVLDIYGYDSVEELRTTPIENRYTPESYAEFKMRREKRKEGADVPSEYTVDIIRKSGEVRHLQVFRKEILWDGERHFQVLYQDITERKQAEEALRKSGERSRLLATYHKRLNDISIAFSEASGTEDLFDRIALSFRILTDAIAATFSVYNRETRNLKAASLSIDPISGDKVGSIFGPDLFEMLMPVSADDLGQMLSQGIKRPKDLCELSFGVIPQEISDAIMDAVGCRQIVALAIIYAEELFGTCVAYLPEDKPVVPDDALKVYSYLSGLAVKRRQAEEALRESETRYRQLVEYAPTAIYEADLTTGRLLSANEVLCEYSGYTRDELLALNPLDLMTEESQKLILQRMAGYAAGEPVPPNVEYKARSKTGREFWISTNAKYFYQEGLPVRATVVAHDITERKQAEDSLQASEKRYRSLFENSIMGISQAHPDGRLIVTNNAYAQMYGYASAEEMMAEVPSVGKLYANPEDREEVLRVLKEKGVMKPREMAVVRRDGARFTILVGAREIRDSNGNLLYYQAEHIDITERKQAENELKTSRSQLRALAIRLQQIREEERIMIAREIHDEMGGGLTGLKIDLGWLLRKMGNADPGEERVALMDKIDTANALIDQMIRVVRRISADLRPSVLDDLGLIAALEWQLAEFTSRTEIRHEFATTFEYVNMEEETAVAVFRIFQEALTNVVRHARATKVTVVLREDERSLFGDESFVLEIRDNGTGITEEEILNPESLGLLGMKERVLTFGGEISIHGKPGCGTALVLKIPRKQGEES
jgi:PAS domain S-box-containing protein